MSKILKKPWDKLRDVNRKIGGDVLGLGGSDENDPFQEYVLGDLLGGRDALDNVNKALGTIPPILDRAKRATVLDAKRLAEEQATALPNYDAGEVINSVQDLQGNISSRLQGLRAGRDESVERRVQPQRQQVAEQAGLARRSIQGEGSRQSSQRSGIMEDKSLANQQVEAQALGEQLSIEGGVQQLETEFTSFFNELVANRFSREFTGLSEEMNEYLSEQGAKIGYDQLEQEARLATNAMYGRFISTIGQEFGNNDKPDNVAGDAYQPAYDYANRYP